MNIIVSITLLILALIQLWQAYVWLDGFKNVHAHISALRGDIAEIKAQEELKENGKHHE